MKDADPIFSRACSSCGSFFQIESLHLLPEEEAYARELSKAVLHGSASPVLPEERALRAKYGFGLGALFCDTCYQGLCQTSGPAGRE